MPSDDESAKQQVTFALAIVKASVISDRAESSKIQSALQVMLPGVFVILVADDGQPFNYRHRQALAEFARNAPCQVITSSRICAN
jgi:hypothetical protein